MTLKQFLKNSLVIILFLASIGPAHSEHGSYTSEMLFTIPWGDGDAEIPSDFMPNDLPPGIRPTSPPGQAWAVSNDEVLAIVYYTFENGYRRAGYLKTFDYDGSFLNSYALSSFEDRIRTPGNVAFSNTGEIALSEACGDLIVIFDDSLNITTDIRLPFEEQTIWDVNSSATGGFYVLFQAGQRKGQYTNQNVYICELSIEGTLSEPEIVWDAEISSGVPARFVTPLGEPTMVFKDQFGYSYGPTEHMSGGWEWGAAISKRPDPYGERIYRNDWESDEYWRRFDQGSSAFRWLYYITWSGDYYTIHATDDGMVLTKYTYHPPSPPNQDPICILDCPTLIMPEVLPIAVVFDASGSYDPDGDPITYHWDFNGDGIFDGVGDEYTGDSWNPTHQFMSYGIHEVSLKVMDDKDGECVETVVIEIVES